MSTTISPLYWDLLQQAQQPNNDGAGDAGAFLCRSPEALLYSLMVIAAPRGTFPPDVIVPAGSIITHYHSLTLKRQSPDFYRRIVDLCTEIAQTLNNSSDPYIFEVLSRRSHLLLLARADGIDLPEITCLRDTALHFIESDDLPTVCRGLWIIHEFLMTIARAFSREQQQSVPFFSEWIPIVGQLFAKYTTLDTLLCATPDHARVLARLRSSMRLLMARGELIAFFANTAWLAPLRAVLDAFSAVDLSAHANSEAVRTLFCQFFGMYADFIAMESFPADIWANSDVYRGIVVQILGLIPRLMHFFPTDLYGSTVEQLLACATKHESVLEELVLEHGQLMATALIAACQLPPAIVSDFTENPGLYFSEAIAGGMTMRGAALQTMRWLISDERGCEWLRLGFEQLPWSELSLRVFLVFVQSLAKDGGPQPIRQWVEARIPDCLRVSSAEATELMRLFLLSELVVHFPDQITPHLQDYVPMLLRENAPPLQFTVGCHALLSLAKSGMAFPLASISPLLGREQDCFSAAFFEAIDVIFVAARDFSPESVGEITRYFMTVAYSDIRGIIPETCDDAIAQRIRTCLSAIAQLYSLPLGAAPPFERFHEFWNALFAIDGFVDAQASDELIKIATSLIAKPVPNALQFLELALDRIPDMKPEDAFERAAVIGAPRAPALLVMDSALYDFLRAVIAAVCAIPDRIAVWEGRGALVDVVLPHFVDAFARPSAVVYDLAAIYQLGMIVGQMISLQWIGEEVIRRVCEMACAVFALDDPVGQPTTVCAAINVIIAGFFAGQEGAVFGAVPDFYARCLAFIEGGGMIGRHNKYLIGRWLAAAADEQEVLVLREAYQNAYEIEPNPRFEREMADMEQFVGWKEKLAGEGQ